MASAASAFGSVLLLVSTAAVVQGQNHWDVAYSFTDVCGLEGSTLELRCIYTNPDPIRYRIIDVYWLSWVAEDSYMEPRKASEFAGRLQESCDGNNCSLRITDLRQTDAGVYYLRFFGKSVEIHGGPGVHVSVTALQLQVQPPSRLHCYSGCGRPDASSYTWYKNGHKLPEATSGFHDVQVSAADSYSCAVTGREDLSSASVCLTGRTCNSVIYTDRSICAFKGSSVAISCTYFSRGDVTSKLWFRSDPSGQSPSQPEDLLSDAQFTGRVQVLEAETGGSTLRITDLTETDSGQFGFSFTAGSFEWGRSLAGTRLTVTDPDLQVLVWTVSGRCCLRCYSSCRLPDHSSYIWYQNGDKITGSQEEILVTCTEADSFSCALSGHEDFPSAPVCLIGRTCNSVIYTDRSICASKGSSVDISCTYSSFRGDVTSKLWFRSDPSGQSPSQPEDLLSDAQFTGRVQVLEAETGGSTLRITELTETDSGQFGFSFTAGSFEWGRSLAGTSLTVTVLQVQVVTSTVQDSYTDAELRCLSSCRPAARPSYVWFKNGQEVTTEGDSYRGRVDAGDAVACALKGRDDYKSASVYAPELPSVSVVLSGQTVENSSVTLTCSSDANPAAHYSWYKRDSHPEPVHQGPQLVFSSIRVLDSGQFYCRAENQLGRRTSGSIYVDVRYPPKTISVSVVPSGHIVENSSVTLTCSSDANPAANYTWYKDDEESPKASGQNFTITGVRAEDGGKYSCEARNSRGRGSSSFYLTVAAGNMNPVVTGIVSAVVLAVILLLVILMRKKRVLRRCSEPGEIQDQRVQGEEEEQEGLQHASVRFYRNPADPVHSNLAPAELDRNQEDTDQATVKLSGGSSGPRVQGPGEDVTPLNSTEAKVKQPGI